MDDVQLRVVLDAVDRVLTGGMEVKLRDLEELGLPRRVLEDECARVGGVWKELEQLRSGDDAARLEGQVLDVEIHVVADHDALHLMITHSAVPFL